MMTKDNTSGPDLPGDLLMEAARRIEALEAGTATLAKRLCDALARLEDADRRVEEEREACAKIAEHFTGNLWDADENALARRITDAIRSREQVSDSSTACSTAPSPIGLADEEVVLAMILRPFMECCEQFCPCATPHKGCQCMNAAVAISTHLHAQRKASDVSDGDLGVPGPTSGPAVPGQSRRIPRAPLQTCAAGSVPEGWKLVPVEATDEMVRAARAAHEGAPYLPMTLYQSMIAASPSPPVIESGECGLTYQHYRTPDEVARRWKHALDLHREHVEHLFSEYEKGTISLGEVKHRAMMLISPISDQDLRLATDEAVGIAEELHRESQTVGGEKADA
jgi:hypothetical protein